MEGPDIAEDAVATTDVTPVVSNKLVAGSEVSVEK
jgi:hypothetical protein